MAKKRDGDRYAALNRKARHEYFIDEEVEAGVMLLGTEVKALRAGLASLGESYAGEKNGELYLFNCHINEYAPAAKQNHAPRRPRKLLVHRKEMDKLLGASSKEGATLIPLSIYFNERGFAKVGLGLARGKKKADKRESIKERDWKRDKQRMMKAREY